MQYAIRRAKEKELNRILDIYESARSFMRKNGNLTQWGEGDRPEDLIRNDIREGNLYTLTDESGEIHAVFAFIIGEDPTYLKIEDGNWLCDESYGAVHRVASDGTIHGVLEKTMDYCRGQISHLRIDTHEDNVVMQHVIEKCGFVRCGIIYVSDGSPRIAYEWSLD